MKNQKLLEMAAKAAGYEFYDVSLRGGVRLYGTGRDQSTGSDGRATFYWNPFDDDADAFRLVVALKLQVVMYRDRVEALHDGMIMAGSRLEYFAGCVIEAARAVIVRAAAEIYRREVEEEN